VSALINDKKRNRRLPGQGLNIEVCRHELATNSESYLIRPYAQAYPSKLLRITYQWNHGWQTETSAFCKFRQETPEDGMKDHHVAELP